MMPAPSHCFYSIFFFGGTEGEAPPVRVPS